MPHSSRSYRTHAIILKRQDLGESDRLLTLFTPHHGKATAVAKGARKPTNAKTGHVELFTKADMLLSKGRDIDILAQSELIEPYLAIHEDLLLGAYASYVVELLDRITYDSDNEQPALFDLLDNTLQRLCSGDSPRLITRYYELHLLDLVGFRPELNECVISHESIEPIAQYFSYLDGGVVRPESVQHAANVVKLPLTTLKVLRFLQRSPYQQVRSLHLEEAVYRDIDRIMFGYITHILERSLQSVDFIKRIQRFTDTT